MIRPSVFTVAALVFYLLSISLGAHFMTDYYKSGIAVIAGNSVTKTPMPCLDIIVVIMNIVLGLRLYLHAWIMDESLDYRRAINSASRFKKSGEWLLRLLWVAGISWLPSAYQKLPLKIGSFSFHIHHFLLLILSFLLIWDWLMNSMIKSYSKKDKRELKENWLYLDVTMAVIILVTSLSINIVPKKETFDMLRILPPLGYSLICAISFIQIIDWIPDIFRAPKISS